MSATEDQSNEVGQFPGLPITPSSDDGKLTAEEQTDFDEWSAAADELFPGLKQSKEDPDEQTQSEEDKKTDGTDEKDSEDQKQDAGKESGADDKSTEADADDTGSEADGKDSEEDAVPEPTDAITRLSAREQQQQIDSIKADVRDKLFGEKITELRDLEGNAIKTPEDLMQYNNQATGQPFTREEAREYLADQKQALADKNTRDDAEIDRITDLNLNLRDQVDVIDYQYGELLKAMPELKDQLWSDYLKTVTQDSKSGIITAAPLRLEDFYRRALEPYAEMGRRLESQDTSSTQQQTEQQAKEDADKQSRERQQRREDRSDIYGNGKRDDRSDDDKEWDDAAKAVFGDQFNISR